MAEIGIFVKIPVPAISGPQGSLLWITVIKPFLQWVITKRHSHFAKNTQKWPKMAQNRRKNTQKYPKMAKNDPQRDPKMAKMAIFGIFGVLSYGTGQ